MVQVTVSEGILEGELNKNYLGGEYYSFKGIPYAEPPIGDLRFKAPQPKNAWNGVRSAKEFGPICYQYDLFFQTLPSNGSEDCLYLNVYTPDLKPSKLLPVMFWIHGGGFTCGNGNDDFYGPEFLVRNGVILVTINYRVEVLGFLSLETEDIPGNAGMKDQVAALRWIKNNIRNFGGDSENITIFGESAGASSVSFHLMSSMSKGLFKRAIAQSGSSSCWWSLAIEPRERALALARKLGCHSEDDKELYEFFKSQPVETLVNIQVPITFVEKAKIAVDLKFGIVNEKKFGDNERFFYGDPYDVIRNGIHEGVEIIKGYTEHEGILNIGISKDIDAMILQINDFREFLVPKPIALNSPINEQFEVGRKFKEFYFKGKSVSKENLMNLTNFFSMEMFVYGIVQWLKIIASQNKNKVYLYKFTCKSERNVFTQVWKASSIAGNQPTVCHADDLPYIFPIKLLGEVDQNSDSFKMIDNVTKLWTNFAKYGNPTPDNSLGVNWIPFSQDAQEYLDIGQQLVAGLAADKEEIEFWEDIFREYCPHFVAKKSS
uniref:Carboxylic ester hydrolase n=1 Tax=Streltzoviella insularis TaxID=1206366 RepID=A0A7D5UMQ1_9NEOP|nr:carboxylesterase 8 [Streltzoviella insularis]